jgi:hypothetical protein
MKWEQTVFEKTMISDCILTKWTAVVGKRSDFISMVVFGMSESCPRKMAMELIITRSQQH